MARLTAKRRRDLPASEFALPGKGEGLGGKGSGAYPIDTPGRARSALSRGAANASPAEQATIKRKVHAKYHGIKIGDESSAESRTARRAVLYSHERSRRYQ